mmetsp:Transcript_13789/g.27276  ORF Transcript_13789/g.27276 Transcript_13789/m.27276 type:complete len:224 (+) Transcript_13789:1653-2324(+)
MAHGAEAVGDEQCCLVRHDAFKRVLNNLLALAVEGAGGLIQEQHLGVSDDGSGYGDALLLPPAQLRAALPDLGIILVRQLRHKVVSMGAPGGCLYPILAHCWVSESNVLTNGAVEKHRLLAYECDLPPQPSDVERPDIPPVQKHPPPARVVPPLQQGDACTLSRARGAHKGGLLTRLDGKGHLAEDGGVFAGGVGEGDGAELDQTRACPPRRCLAFGACWVDF